jgi:hypothetical protein
VPFGQPLDGGEAEAEARRAVALPADVGLEDRLAQLGLDAGTGVLDLHARHGAAAAAAHRHPPLGATAHVLDGVADEVAEEARQHARATAHHGVRTRIDDQLGARAGRLGAQRARHFGDHLVEIGARAPLAARAGAGELEQSVHQPQHAVDVLAAAGPRAVPRRLVRCAQASNLTRNMSESAASEPRTSCATRPAATPRASD